MGASLSLLAPQAHTVALRSYIDVLPLYKFLDVVNDLRFLKTVKAYDTATQSLIIIKVFIKPPLVGVQLHSVAEQLAKEALLLAQYPNTLPWHKIIETDLAGYVVRQLARTNLYDRISLRPFLAGVEKCWVVFQMLRIAELLHEHLHICHGNIKTENLLVTGTNWVMLADFAQHLKPVYLPDDNPSEFVFYFDSSDRRSCYVAPERFYAKGDPIAQARKDWRLTDSMDLFSIGCVIAELYLDGEPTFTLSDLYKYKRGELEPNLAIADPNIRAIVKSLLALDPAARGSALLLLAEYRDVCFPLLFYDYLYDFMTELNSAELFAVDQNDHYSPGDLRIEKIYDSFGDIAQALGYDYPHSDHLPYGEKFPYLRLNLKGMLKNYTIRPSSEFENQALPDYQGALMLLDVVCSLLSSVKRPANKSKACELILALSERISDESKLDRSLPYLCSLLEEFIDQSLVYVPEQQDTSNFTVEGKLSSRVAKFALVAITNLLASCTTVNAINGLVFPEYIAPILKNIAFLNTQLKEETNQMKCSLANCFPYLAQISEQFSALANPLATSAGDAVTAKGEVLGSFDISKTRLEADFKDISEALLTDPNASIRISLVQNILPLCQFFGVDKTNDIILPHLITYLNDPYYQLRLAFLSAIIDIGNFIGVLAFEQYLLPLLIQTLGDHELFVVLKVLEVFYFFVSEKLVNPKAKFNVLSIYKELLSGSIILLLQPNEWIRQSVTYLILAISDNLLNADRFCFLYPMVKSYLSHDISEFTWDTLYPCLTRPLSKQVYEAALNWLSNATNKSLFWKQTKFSAFQANGKRKLVSFSKDMGKSVYINRSHSNGSLNGEERANLDITLSPEDRQWILRLKAVGMDEKELWKVFALKDHFFGLTRSSAFATSSDQTEFDLAANVNVPPTNIFFTVCYKLEPIPTRGKGTEISLEAPGANKALSVRSRRDSNSLHLASDKASASLQTVETNVFGEMEFSHEAERQKSRGMHHNHVHLTGKEAHVSHKVFSVNNEKIISATMTHNFEGSNPHILKYLQGLDFEPTLDDFAEFGHVLKGNRESAAPGTEGMSIQGHLVARINGNRSSNELEAFTKVAACPSSEFFVTGSDTGNLKVWDTNKLEKMASGENASLTLNLGYAITDIEFMPHRFVFAVTTSDGFVRIFRVQIVRGKNRKILTFSKLLLIRSAKLEKGFARSVTFVTTTSKTLCVMVTSACQIVAYEVIKMEPEFFLQNPLHYGVPSTFIVSPNGSWLLLGTSDQILCLWDLRFQILLKAWKVTVDDNSSGSSEIKKLMLIPNPTNSKKHSGTVYFAMIGGSTGPDITVWEIPSFECRQIYTANESNPKIKTYALQKLEQGKEMSVEDMFTEFCLDIDVESNQMNTALFYVAKANATSSDEGHFVTATSDNRVVIWNLKDIGKSVLLFTDKEVSFTKNQISAKLSIAYEKVVDGGRAKSRPDDRGEHDAILDVAVLTRPYYQIVAVERNGFIHVYK